LVALKETSAGARKPSCCPGCKEGRPKKEQRQSNIFTVLESIDEEAAEEFA
jgi:hypothetical protein